MIGEPQTVQRELIERRVTVESNIVCARVTTAGAIDAVLLHGIPGSARTWDAVVDHLPPQVRPIVPDLIGFGASSRASSLDDLHAEGQARVLAHALDALGVVRPLLIAHDFGGPVALRLLMQDPDRYSGLLLAATNAFSDTPVPFPLSLVRLPVLGRLFERLLFARPSLAMMCRTGAKQARIDTSVALGDAAQVAAIRTIFAGSLRDLAGLYGPIQSALPNISVPVRVLWGGRDPFFAVTQGQRLADAIPHATMRVLEDCGHFLPDEAPDDVAAEIAGLASTTGAVSLPPSPTIRPSRLPIREGVSP